MPLSLGGNGVISGIDWAGTGGGLAHITTSTFSAASTVSVNNCFTSTYENYRIEFHATMSSSTPTMRLRVSSSDNSTSNYSYSAPYCTSWSGAATGAGAAAGTSWGMATGITEMTLVLDILNPAVAKNTYANGNWTVSTGGGAWNGVFAATTVFDGFSIIGTSMTGTVRVYGYIND